MNDADVPCQWRSALQSLADVPICLRCNLQAEHNSLSMGYLRVDLLGDGSG
jgi:hypothetical protein